jgi:hypothetical protein
MAAKKPGAKAARKKLLKKPATKRKARLRAALMHKVESVEAASPGHRQVNAALSEAEELLAQHKANGESLALKGFAELALNSDLLSRAFRVFGEAYKSEDLLGLSAEYEQLGDQANAIVENLQADLKESAAFPDSHHLESTYRGMVDVVMDGCELYEIIGEELAEEVERASGNSLGN